MSGLQLDEDFDEAARVLCPDGNCTGLLGADGTCKVCGAKGELPEGGLPSSADGDGDGDGDDAHVHAHDPVHVAGDEEDGFAEDRQLCSDGSCTGLIGETGACKLCGRPAA